MKLSLFILRLIRKPVNTLCGQNAGLFIVKAAGIYNYHCALSAYERIQRVLGYLVAALCSQ
jgi:hypothetical protein